MINQDRLSSRYRKFTGPTRHASLGQIVHAYAITPWQIIKEDRMRFYEELLHLLQVDERIGGVRIG